MIEERKLQKPEKIIYPELSYQIIGAAFAVYNALGPGHKEIYYQRAFAEELKNKNIGFARESGTPLFYKGKIIGKYIPDFVIDDKIIIELKVRPRLGYTNIKQVTAYLSATNLPLAILIYFLKDGVKYRRILKPKQDNSPQI